MMMRKIVQEGCSSWSYTLNCELLGFISNDMILVPKPQTENGLKTQNCAVIFSADAMTDDLILVVRSVSERIKSGNSVLKKNEVSCRPTFSYLCKSLFIFIVSVICSRESSPNDILMKDN